ncbi:HAMP domain-containing sensor histidine kinase [uncultured Sphingomonas sp.]|uniref:sensor histidine kinase n=1 Tax=uncultured Sphingomonas sp. TaxID=158754 RepID=UPI0025F711D0|nr:HAMP domain-containing sensor histidine kinase [uncultured Sphingomonas sp.]
MKAPFQSLRGLTIAFLALFLTVTVAAGLGSYFGTLRMIVALVDERIRAEADVLAPPGARIDLRALTQRMETMARQRDTGDLGLLLSDARGRRIAGNARFRRELPLGFSSLSGRDAIEGLSAGRVLVRDLGGGLRLAIFAETEPIDHYFAVRRQIHLFGFGAIIVVALAGLLLFRRLVARRIDEMCGTAGSIAAGDLARRVPLNGDGGAFDRQAAAFNAMLDRIGTLVAEIRNVTNDISHELRTPLARLRNELAAIEDRTDAEPVAFALHAATAQADALLEMFSALLRIASIESRASREAFAPLRLDQLAGDVAALVEPYAAETAHRLDLRAPATVEHVGDRALLMQMLLNLVENAIRHTPPRSRITIGVEARIDASVLIVEDDGPGIPADARALALRRFGRLDTDEGGHGLGLPLAQSIARLHGGTLVLEDAGPGLRVVVALPR